MAWSKNMDWSLYYSIPKDLPEPYLKRLEVGKKAPSREYLDELVTAHLTKIPFENLDVTDLARSVSLEPERLMKKLLCDKRGGFCFELNGAFYFLLRSLGFDAWMCPCRQLRHSEPCPVPATHCGILVYLDGKELFCDVGYGGPVPRGSLEIKADCMQSVGNGTFRFLKSGIVPQDRRSRQETSGWYTLMRKSQRSGRELPLMQMAPIQLYPSDFCGQSLLRSCGDTAYGVRHVSRMTEDGFVDLTGSVLTVKQNDAFTAQTIAEDRLFDILRTQFGIEMESNSQKGPA